MILCPWISYPGEPVCPRCDRSRPTSAAAIVRLGFQSDPVHL